MKSVFFSFFAFLIFLSCSDSKPSTPENWEHISDNVSFQEDTKVLRLKSGKFNYEIDRSKLPYKKAILLNASLVGYFTELNLESSIIGISSPEYIYAPNLQQLVKDGAVANVGNDQKYDIEKIIGLGPDVIFTNYIASFENTYDLLRKNKIELIFLDEYVENKPLDKTKYLLLFGKLFQKENIAEKRFADISASYDSLKTLAKKSVTRPVVLANEMYGNQWFLPGGQSNLATFIEDANADYINKDNTETRAVPLSFEEVFAKSKNAQFWVNVGNHKKKADLLQINPNYTQLSVYQGDELYTISGREMGKANDYFESGVLRADLVLKDYIRIFHPNLLPHYKLTYLKKLE